jgi:Protein of unknown function (DUF3352)
MLRASALTLTCAVLALIAAGCGESGSGGDDGPAALVPASASVYAEAAVRPEGELRDDALAAAGKILRTEDPAGKLRELIDKGLADDGLTWERDFAPWVGEDAGVWAGNLQAPKPSFALIVSTKDADAAKAALAKFEQTSDSAYTGRSYDGIDYRVDDEGMAVGMIDDFVVGGTEDAFKRTADARDSEQLVDSDRYDDVVGELDEDRLGHVFVDGKGLFDVALRDDPEAARNLDRIKSILPFDKVGPTAFSFQADAGGLLAEGLTIGLPEGPLREIARLTSFGGTKLLGELPGESWGAWAVPQLGESARSLFNAFAGAFGGAAVAAQVEQATGLDLQEDVFSWIGDVGVFVRGTDMASLDGALVISATDEDRAAAAFGKIVGLIGKESGTPPRPVKVDGAEAGFSIATPDAGKDIVLARGAGRVVAAYGEEAASAALDPDAKLGDAGNFAAADDVLGDVEPAFLLSIADAIKLADATGGTDAEFEKARPYLEAFGVVAAGGKSDGDRVESSLAVTLR